jgi:Bacterial membrane protein YfhO
MTKVEIPPTAMMSVAPEYPSEPERMRRISLQKLASSVPFLLVAFAVLFSMWLLRAEVRVASLPNDETVHNAMARLAELNIRAGSNPFDAWFPYLGFGVPQFAQYQSLPSILTGLLNVVFGASTFRWVNYLLICTWPISVYIGARLLGVDRWEAGASALISPMLVNIKGYGFEWGSFVWLGSGMWSMLWAIWLMPIALGLAWRAVSRGERVALATFAVGLTCAFHFITGYFVLLSLGVFVLVKPPEALKRIGRSALVGVGGLLMFAFVFVPTISDLNYVNLDSTTRGTFWVDSFGPGHVFTWLFHGEVFDYGRAPIISLLVAAGAFICIAEFRRLEVARVPLGLMALSLLLYSGRTVVGPVIDRLPGGTDLLLHRFIIGVHFAGIMLAGLGAVGIFRLVVSAGRQVMQFEGRQVGVAIACVLCVVLIWPVLVNRKHYGDSNTFFVKGQVAADHTYGADAVALINIAKQRNDGRIYAGSSTNWGTTTRIDQVPIYQLPAQHETDGIGFYLRVSSLSTDIEPYFDETDPAQYDLFNVKYVLTPATRQPTVPATLIATRGDYKLWEVKTSGYLEVVDTTEAVRADRTDMAAVFTPYITSSAVRQLRVPLVAFDGKATPKPSSSLFTPSAGSPGVVDWSNAALADGRFTGQVTASRPSWVMLKESYYPRWTATVDGKPVQPQMLAPSFVGVPVPAGTHLVVFKYRPRSSYPLLFALSAFVLLAFALGPLMWRRWNRRKRPSKESRAAIPG